MWQERNSHLPHSSERGGVFAFNIFLLHTSSIFRSCPLGLSCICLFFQKKDFKTTLQNISFTGKIKERNFEGVKDAETEELYGQALTKLKEALQQKVVFT